MDKLLISLALKFEPIFIAANDPIGLAKHSAYTLSECELAPKIVSKVANRTDADKCLDENESLHNEMTNSMAGLLELARYDVTEFHRWVQAGYPVPQS